MTFITLITSSPFYSTVQSKNKKKAFALFHLSGLLNYSIITIRVVLAPSRSVPAFRIFHHLYRAW